ncbi:MAG: Integrase catalytic region [Caballeronia mineralivorans]|jgi:hypothetical protein|nr:Integrase catalytic region [Caballeronia mineralivorans]
MTVDFRLSANAAGASFLKAIKSQGIAPKTITLDGYAASHRAVQRSSFACSTRTTYLAGRYTTSTNCTEATCFFLVSREA